MVVLLCALLCGGALVAATAALADNLRYIMRWTQSLIITQKSAPSDAPSAGLQFLLRSGMIRQAMAGVYEYLPVGRRCLRKLEILVESQMLAAGAMPVRLPAMQSMELWEKTAGGSPLDDRAELFRLKDREGRLASLAFDHAPAAVELAGGLLRSYKQLPARLFQIGRLFRDDAHPRLGLLRLREFTAASLFSFQADAASMREEVGRLCDLCRRIFEPCGIPARLVDGAGGSRQFVITSELGHSTVAVSERGEYAATLDAARTSDRPWSFDAPARGELERVYTPDLPSIEQVSAFLQAPPAHLLKTLVHRVTGHGEISWLVAVVRGDHELNSNKLADVVRQRFGIERFELADDADVRREWPIGFVGPDLASRKPSAVLVVDPDAAADAPWVAGGNESDYHVRNFNWRRELGTAIDNPKKLIVADIRNALDGDPSPDGSPLKLVAAIKLARITAHGDRLSKPLNAVFVDEHGQQQPLMLAACEIGLDRLLGALAEISHDDRGLIWPKPIAPYAVVITPIQYDGATRQAADALYEQLMSAGVDALLDDRTEPRAGAKFADADLLGIPLRINIGERGLKEGKVEFKFRRTGEVTMVPLEEAAAWLGPHCH